MTTNTKRRTNAYRVLDRQHALNVEINSIVGEAIRNHYTHARILDMRQERIFSSRHWPRLTQTAKGEVIAYFHGATAVLWHMVDWRHTLGGELIPAHDPRLAGRYQEITSSGHYWIGTEHPFTESRLA